EEDDGAQYAQHPPTVAPRNARRGRDDDRDQEKQRREQTLIERNTRVGEESGRDEDQHIGDSEHTCRDDERQLLGRRRRRWTRERRRGPRAAPNDPYHGGEQNERNHRTSGQDVVGFQRHEPGDDGRK